jgi:hypothetical protein
LEETAAFISRVKRVNLAWEKLYGCMERENWGYFFYTWLILL